MNGYDDMQIPEPTLPKWQRINTRPFEIEVVPRELRRAAVGGGGATGGAFYTMRTVASEDATNGDIYLQGGSVSGYGTPVGEFLLFDQSLDGGAGEWTGDPGEILQLIVTVAGSESSGIPNSGVTPTSVSSITVETALGTNTYPTGAGSMTGKLCHINLGAFFDGGFGPAAAGNINIGWCFNNAYNISRE